MKEIWLLKQYETDDDSIGIVRIRSFVNHIYKGSRMNATGPEIRLFF